MLAQARWSRLGFSGNRKYWTDLKLPDFILANHVRITPPVPTMIIWSGKGFLSVLFLLGGIIITQGCIETITGQKPAQMNHDLMWGCSFVLAAVANYFLVRHLRKTPKRVLGDKATGEEFEMSDVGSLFFISTRWWTHVYAVIAVFFLVRLF